MRDFGRQALWIAAISLTMVVAPPIFARDASTANSPTPQPWLRWGVGAILLAAGGAAIWWHLRTRREMREMTRRMDLAAEVARELSGRLIHAQEDERRRIARDLHDDLNQRLALLSVEMELLRQTPGLKPEFEQRLEQAAAHVSELSSDVHKLSYGLHPAKLDQLGLVAAARSFCRELTQQSGIAIHFSQDQVPREIPAEIALSFYRVMQESSQNLVRHSRAKEAKVHLRFAQGELNMTIADTGAGFEAEAARQKRGLGLISMEERIRLIHGVFDIRSRPGFGTQISVRVRLPANGPPASQPAVSN